MGYKRIIEKVGTEYLMDFHLSPEFARVELKKLRIGGDGESTYQSMGMEHLV